jgi:hypothetical protein
MGAAALQWWSEPIRRRYARWHRAAASAPGVPPFRSLLGEAAWGTLPAAVQRRFARHLAAGACVTYAGEVAECRRSWAGWALAQAARVIGAPLPLFADTHVAASVTVTGDGKGGQYWVRQYGRAHGFPQVIHSCKRFAGPTGLEEYLGLGFGIALQLRVEDGALLFVSDHYFWQCLGARIAISRYWLGHLTIGHVDLGDGRFAFTLDLIHPLLGELVHQLAMFADCEGAR